MGTPTIKKKLIVGVLLYIDNENIKYLIRL